LRHFVLTVKNRIFAKTGSGQTQETLANRPVSAGAVRAVAYDTLTWGEGWQYTLPPKVDTKKWLTYGKHQTNICDRWAQNKVAMAGTAMINGIGMESWENDWGTFNGAKNAFFFLNRFPYVCPEPVLAK
jgi:hypothetical protein